MEATATDLSSNVFGRSEQSGLRYDITVKLYWASDGMNERHSTATFGDGKPSYKRWVFNDAVRDRDGDVGHTSGEVEAGAAITVYFPDLRSPSIIDAQRIALARLADALTEAEMETHIRQPLYTDATVRYRRQT